ncbi:hypothetical protein ACOMHN_067225 [Nucella lapillus]
MFGDVHTEEKLDFLCENRGPSPVCGANDDDDNASQSSSATVIGRPTRRGLSAVRGDDDDDDNASQSSSASVTGAQPVEACHRFATTMMTMTTRARLHLRPSSRRPTCRGLSPVRYDDDDDDNASQTSSASVIGRPTRRGLSPVRGDGDDDDNASLSPALPHPSSGAQPHEACHRFATMMTMMTTRARLHLRPSSGAPPAEACHRFAATMMTMTTRARLHLRLHLTTELVYRAGDRAGSWPAGKYGLGVIIPEGVNAMYNNGAGHNHHHHQDESGAVKVVEKAAWRHQRVWRQRVWGEGGGGHLGAAVGTVHEPHHHLDAAAQGHVEHQMT